MLWAPRSLYSFNSTEQKGANDYQTTWIYFNLKSQELSSLRTNSMFNNAITPCLAVIYYIGTYYYMQALLIYSIYYTQLGLPAYQKSRVSFH